VESTTQPRVSQSLLEVDHLAIEYREGFRPRRVRVVDDVSFALGAGESVTVVGEPGSGKSALGGAILGLRPIAGGTIRFRGEDITRAGGARRRALGGHLQAVFQNPSASLDPSHTVGAAIAEPLAVGGTPGREEVRSRVADILSRVGLDPAEAVRYPNEFSARQLQLVAIARALVSRPALVVCDEVVSALDPATRSRVFDLLDELQAEAATSYLFLARESATVGIGARVLTLAGGRLTGR
jgi:ABC-type glutathione transport system ATPase component